MEMPKKKILIVDHNYVNVTIFKYYLKGIDCDFVHANNGMEAIEHLSSTGIDLVITAVHLPLMDGFVLAEKIRDRNIEIPIIAVCTAEDHIDLCVEPFINGTILLPAINGELLDKVKEFI